MESHVFPFMKLPGEVRNEIYRLLLVHDRPVRLPCDFSIPCNSAATSLQVLRLCRQITEEASPIFYQENFFDLRPELLLNLGETAWDCPLGYRQHVRKISIRLDHPCELGHPYCELTNPFKQFMHLEEIEIHYRTSHDEKEDAPASDEYFKAWLRHGKSIVGNILSDMPFPVDIWLIEQQFILSDPRTSGSMRGKSEAVESADDGGDSDENMSEKSTSQPSPDVDDDSEDGLSNDDGCRSDTDGADDKELLYNQRFIIRKAILDSDHEKPHRVLLDPGLVEEWSYAPWAENWPHLYIWIP